MPKVQKSNRIETWEFATSFEQFLPSELETKVNIFSYPEIWRRGIWGTKVATISNINQITLEMFEYSLILKEAAENYEKKYLTTITVIEDF